MNILSKTAIPEGIWVLIFVAFFAVIVLGIILVKKYVKPLQIKKDEMDEKEAVKQELDRVLVPVEDEDIKRQMEEAAKKEEQDAE